MLSPASVVELRNCIHQTLQTFIIVACLAHSRTLDLSHRHGRVGTTKGDPRIMDCKDLVLRIVVEVDV